MVFNRSRFAAAQLRQKHHTSWLGHTEAGPLRRIEASWRRAVTLTEVAIAIAILAIATLGGLGYQYLAAEHSRTARAQIIGIRTAQLLLEDWKSDGGSEFYDPNALGLGFSTLTPFSSGAEATTDTAIYSITVDNIPMQISLRWKDRPGNPDYDDPATGGKLRELSVTVRFAVGSTQEGAPPVFLNTYVKID